MSANQTVAIIPARGGSKGVPGKNIKLLLGKPLIQYTIDEAAKSKYINRIIVSTDDEEIARVAERCGALVPFMRPDDLALDDTLDLPVFQHALGWLLENEEYKPEMVAHLRPTAPLRTAEHIDLGIETLLQSDADSLRSVCPAPKHPFKMWKFSEKELIPFFSEDIRPKESYNMARQQLSPVYIQNGSVDIIWRETIMTKNSMTGDKILGMLMEEGESANIDTLIDFALAEQLLKNRKNGKL